MARKSTAPVQTANADDQELPKTAVVPRGKDAVIQNLQEQLAGYMEEPTSQEPEPSNEEDTFKKRYGDLRRHLQQKENQFKSEVGQLKTQVQQLTAAANQPMPQNKEDLEAWKAKYPQIANFIETIADEKASKRSEQLQEELSNVKVKLTETEKEKSFATLKVMVPDIEDIVRSQEFNSWKQNQPQFVQEELNTSEDPHRIAYWINIYQMATKAPSKAKKEDKLAVLDASAKNTGVTPSANSGKWSYTQAQIAKMSPEEYAAKEEDIIAARNAGKILDDTRRYPTVFEV